MVNESKVRDLLSSHGLKKTPIRAAILDVFMNHEFALSASDLLAKMRPGNDRVTVYRALSSFESHGILHRASEDRQGVKYALCQQSCPHETHTDRHVHFICEACQQTFCLSEVTIPEVDISSDFTVHRVSYTINGICHKCKASAD